MTVVDYRIVIQDENSKKPANQVLDGTMAYFLAGLVVLFGSGPLRT